MVRDGKWEFWTGVGGGATVLPAAVLVAFAVVKYPYVPKNATYAEKVIFWDFAFIVLLS